MKKLLRLLAIFGPGMIAGLLLPSAAVKAQAIDFGKSYVNISKGAGGTVEPGDILEIRASFVVRSNSFDSCAFFDTIPAGTEYMAGTVRVLTNEGKIYKQFTDASGDDEGRIVANQYVRINLGYNQGSAPATAYRRGRVAFSDRPSIYNYTCIMIASYRVRVTAALNSFIYTGGGTCTYQASKNNLQTFRFPNNRVYVYTNFGICANSVGVNALGTEFNGTFGSGKARNRGPSGNVPTGYTYATFTANSPQDYYYGIPNNTSINSGYTTSNQWPNPDAAHRVFRLWDIIGDHTGAADPFTGNPAADTVANSNAGYMLVINAAYRIDSAFQQTISNLCPNTYYEVSLWMRNICSRCGCDSTGKSADTPGYLPTAAGDSSGVYPNLTFEIDGTDYYTTGNLQYTGKWVKKGFVFKTDATQTACTLKIFNNAPGGGGNDWALDDISVATCSPNLTFTPSNDPLFCNNNVVTMGSTVRSFFDNYTEYKWQRSTNDGSSWSDLSTGRSTTPQLNGGAWEYHIDYPQFVGTRADSGHKYRMVVATTTSNLNNSSCAFFGNTAVLTLHVQTCTTLAQRFLSFTGNTTGGYNQLQWRISSEAPPTGFIIEHSWDGLQFSAYAAKPYNGNNHLTWQEPAAGAAPFYRVLMVMADGSRIASGAIQLRSQPVAQFALIATNPFRQRLHYTVLVPATGTTLLQLYDAGGRRVWQKQDHLVAGRHYLQEALDQLPAGIYFLVARHGQEEIRQKLIKQNAP